MSESSNGGTSQPVDSEAIARSEAMDAAMEAQGYIRKDKVPELKPPREIEFEGMKLMLSGDTPDEVIEAFEGKKKGYHKLFDQKSKEATRAKEQAEAVEQALTRTLKLAEEKIKNSQPAERKEIAEVIEEIEEITADEILADPDAASKKLAKLTKSFNAMLKGQAAKPTPEPVKADSAPDTEDLTAKQRKWIDEQVKETIDAPDYDPDTDPSEEQIREFYENFVLKNDVASLRSIVRKANKKERTPEPKPPKVPERPVAGEPAPNAAAEARAKIEHLKTTGKINSTPEAELLALYAQAGNVAW